MSSLELASEREEYAAAANRVLDEVSTIEEEAQKQAITLILSVVQGEDVTSAINNLRKGVVWANALDREATVEDGVAWDETELIARRIMHHAGRSALERVKTENRLTRWRALYAAARGDARRQVLSDNTEIMHSLSVENLVQYMQRKRD